MNLSRATCLIALSLTALHAESRPAFEVASVHPFDRTSQPGHGRTDVSGSRVTMTGYTLLGLIQYAYDLRAYQISGGPGWINMDTYSVAAKAEGDTAPATDDIRKMLQTLLADRFNLQVHRETKEERVYLMEPAKTGPKVKASTAQRTTMRMGPGSLAMVKATPAQMAALLSSVLNRPVLDHSGLTGEFDFSLESPDINMGRMPAEDVSGPSIFTAVQEQLGLKLEQGKGPIEILVIDHAAKPVE
jgi:uncharacterized protein (TIGR03435 family)